MLPDSQRAQECYGSNMTQQQNPEETRKGLINVMVYGTAIAFGGMAAFLVSLRDIRDDPALVFSYRTVVGFVVGAVLGWLFWRGVWYLERRNGERR